MISKILIALSKRKSILDPSLYLLTIIKSPSHAIQKFVLLSQ